MRVKLIGSSLKVPPFAHVTDWECRFARISPPAPGGEGHGPPHAVTGVAQAVGVPGGAGPGRVPPSPGSPGSCSSSRRLLLHLQPERVLLVVTVLGGPGSVVVAVVVDFADPVAKRLPSL